MKIVNLSLTVLITIAILPLGCNLFEGKYRFNEKPLSLSEKWTDVVPRQVVTCNRQYQRVLVNLTTPYKVEPYGPDSPKIILQDGTTPIIECELVGVDGTVYPYRSAGILYQDDERYPMFDEHGDHSQEARDRSYRAVRLRSSRPVIISEVRLSCSSPPLE